MSKTGANPRTSEQLDAYLAGAAQRKRFQFKANAVAAVAGGFFFGLLNAMVAFTMGYIGSSIIGKMAANLTVGYVTTVFKMMMPFSFLVPYSNLILLGILASATIANLAYAYRTGTHGFEMPSMGSTLRFLAYTAPVATFFAGLSLGVSPMAAFKLTWAVGTFCGLGLTAEPLMGMWSQLPVNTPPAAKKSENQVDDADKPKPAPTPMPSQTFDGSAPKVSKAAPGAAVINQLENAQAKDRELSQKAKETGQPKEPEEAAPKARSTRKRR